MHRVEVVGLSIQVDCGVDYYGTDDGYNRHENVIRKIVDKHGKAVRGVWKKGWTQIATGIELASWKRWPDLDGTNTSNGNPCEFIALPVPSTYNFTVRTIM